MINLTKYLLEEAKIHPSLAPQDVVKLCYQAAFGAEHLLSDHTQAMQYFYDEYEATPIDSKPLAEFIAPTVCRVNLSAWKRLKLDPAWLWKLFAKATGDMPNKDNKVFTSYISQADELIKTNILLFSYPQWIEYINEYVQGESTGTNFPPVRHSAAYRENEKPAYRILSGQAAKALPIFEAMSGRTEGIIAIDGRAASGKTTLAGYLQEIIPAGVIPMDDFFLPPELRTAERLDKPGGNIHHERFAQEILPYLRSNNEFKYRKFDCNSMEYSDTPAKALPYPWRIVEGVYSLHPVLGNYMDIRVFLDIQSAEQKSRIETRNSEKIAAMYLNKWIPMEDMYFDECGIRESANILICDKKDVMFS